ncbi:hypothetical protein BC628DRAFT_360001 [Trametes gibbosa]|nr:hypothetical protein BC628DRAFT_360001 [Trametes gibbosa]
MRSTQATQTTYCYSTFWTWPQHVDDLLEDMHLPIMRSGGNAFTWPFKFIELEEVRNLKEERDEARRDWRLIHHQRKTRRRHTFARLVKSMSYTTHRPNTEPYYAFVHSQASVSSSRVRTSVYQLNLTCRSMPTQELEYPIFYLFIGLERGRFETSLASPTCLQYARRF